MCPKASGNGLICSTHQRWRSQGAVGATAPTGLHSDKIIVVVHAAELN